MAGKVTASKTDETLQKQIKLVSCAINLIQT